MKTFLICASAFASVLAIQAVFRHTKPESPAPSKDVAELKQELSGLRARVVTAEAMGATALANTLAPKRSDVVDGETRTAGAPDARLSAERASSAPSPARPREEDVVRTFHTYFDQIDALRGNANDPVAAAKVDALLAKHDWKEGGGGEPASSSVTCGNGLCRMSLRFKDLNDAEVARSKLVYELTTAVDGASMFLDPSTLELEAYFGNGRPLPPFPTSTN